MSDKESKTILFLCTGNACRSQMAEGFARKMMPDWKVYSAGIIAAGLNLQAVAAMKEIGIDISRQYSKTLDEIQLDQIDYVVTLCGHARDHCPVFPSSIRSEHWPIDDPICAVGTPVEKEEFRRVRDEIRSCIEQLAERLKGECDV